MQLSNNEIFIQGNVPSLKNSRVKTSKGIFPSKTCMKYLRSLGVQSYSASRKVITGYKTRPNIFLDSITDEFKECLKQAKKPVKLGFYFIRDSNRRFDYINALQLPLDMCTAAGIIEDDDASNICPVIMEVNGNLGYHVDKNNPGIIIKVLN